MKLKPAKLFALLSILLYFSVSCSRTDLDSSWRGNPPQVISHQEAEAEIAQKMDLVGNFLRQEGLEGMLLTQVRNVNWITAGLVNTQIELNKDVGAASLLVMHDGGKYLLCNGSEAPRLMDETLADLGYELKLFNWYQSNPQKDVRGHIIEELAGDGRIGSDIDYPGTVVVAERFKRLRFSLLDSEIKRYRWLARQSTEAVVEVCRQIKPGMNEYEIEFLTARALRARGIIPTVLLVAVDDRIYNYRHALSGGAELEKYAMVNICAKKWGMTVAVTRFVHFGPLPAELGRKMKASAAIMAHYQAATVPGKATGEIFEQCKQWYAEVGYDGEWKEHHQGGAIGYDAREYVIYPGIGETVQNRQAFAWNPTIAGAKVEDTFIVYPDSIEIVTVSEDWPLLEVELDGKTYYQPDILVR